MKKIYLVLLFIVVNTIYAVGQSIDPGFNIPLFSGMSEISATLRLPGDKLLVAGQFVAIGTTPRAGRLVLLNPDGSIDNSFNPGKGFATSAWLTSMAAQPDGKIIIAGFFSQYNGIAVEDILRLNLDGSLDTSFNPGTGAGMVITSPGLIQSMAIQNDGKILASGDFPSFNGVARPGVVRLNNDGSVDSSFNPAITFSTGGEFARSKVWIQQNGKILVSGAFAAIDGTSTSSLVRLNADGTLDTSFTTALGTGFDVRVTQLALQSDGKILAVGNFSSVNGITLNKMARLNADGSVDATFPANLGFNSGNSLSTVLVLSDNSILVSGNFQSPKNRILKLSANGVVDNTLNVGTGIASVYGFADVTSIAVQSDGKVILAGSFSHYNDQACISLVRINSNGSFDPGYKPNPASMSYVRGILPTADGKVYVAGDFLFVNGVETKIGLVRLNADGTRDAGFNISGGGTATYGSVATIELDDNGKLLVGGDFRIYSTNYYYGFARFNTDGSVDNTWTSFTGLTTAFSSDGVFEIKPQADGKIIIGGAFTKVNGQDRAHFARLNADGTLDDQFNSANGYTDLQTRNFQVRSTDSKMILPQYPRNGVAASKVSLVNPDGSRDNAFDVNSKFNGSYVYKAIFTNNGKILVGGDFTQYDGQAANKLIRLNDTGVRDATFTVSDAMAGYVVRELVPLGSGLTLVGKGSIFSSGVATDPTNYLDVVDDNGNLISEDLQINGDVLKIAVTTSHIYLGGRITAAGNTQVFSLVRLTNPAAPTTSPSALTTVTEIGPRRNILTWTDNSTTETGFEIQRSSPTNSSFAKIGVAPANATTFTDATGLAPAIQYHYRLKAVNVNGETGYSNESAIATLPDPPAAPSALLVSPASSSQMQVKWTDNSANETGFEVYRSATNNTSFTKVVTTAANVTTYADTGLPPSIPYFYKVRAINPGGVSDFTAEVSSLILGVSEFFGKSIVIYPNPVSTDLVLENPTTESAGVECYNTVGGRVLGGEKISPNSSLGLKVSDWPSGIYFVSVRFFDRVETHKVLKF